MKQSKIGLEKLASMYKKHDKVAEAEILHHPNLKAILDNGYTFLRGDTHMGMFIKDNDWVCYDHSTNKIWFEYTHGHAHKKTKIEYL